MLVVSNLHSKSAWLADVGSVSRSVSTHAESGASGMSKSGLCNDITGDAAELNANSDSLDLIRLGNDSGI